MASLVADAHDELVVKGICKFLKIISSIVHKIE